MQQKAQRRMSMTRFDIIVLLLCIPMFVGCKDNTPAIIKQALMQEQKQIVELRMKRREAVQEKIIACDHKFDSENLSWRCVHCGIHPDSFVNKQF